MTEELEEKDKIIADMQRKIDAKNEQLSEYRDTIKELKSELNFYRSIDFVGMGRFIEYDKGCDLTGWEFLADAWRNKNEAKALWYIQQRWNKNYHFNEIFDENKDEDNKEFRTLLSHHSYLLKMYKEQEIELEELQAKNI